MPFDLGLQKYPQLCIRRKWYRRAISHEIIDSMHSICMRLRFAIIYGNETMFGKYMTRNISLD